MFIFTNKKCKSEQRHTMSIFKKVKKYGCHVSKTSPVKNINETNQTELLLAGMENQFVNK